MHIPEENVHEVTNKKRKLQTKQSPPIQMIGGQNYRDNPKNVAQV